MSNIPKNLLVAIDTIAAGLAKQRKRSVAENGTTCLYRGADGCKCAIGWILPQQFYKEAFEGEAPDVLIMDDNLEDWTWDLGGVNRETKFKLETALCRFQDFHDYYVGSLIPGDRSYERMLEVHAKDSDEVLAAAIKAELTHRAESVYNQ